MCDMSEALSGSQSFTLVCRLQKLLLDGDSHFCNNDKMAPSMRLRERHDCCLVAAPAVARKQCNTTQKFTRNK